MIRTFQKASGRVFRSLIKERHHNQQEATARDNPTGANVETEFPSLTRLVETTKRFYTQYKAGQKTQNARERRKHWPETVTAWGVAVYTAVTGVTAGFAIAGYYVAKDSLVDVQRAVLTSYEISVTEIDAPDLHGWKLTPMLENAGNTSAVDIRYGVNRFYGSPVILGLHKIRFAPGANNPDQVEIEFTGLPKASLTLAPHAKIPLAPFVLPQATANMLQSGTLNIYVFGEAEYSDVFGGWHRTKFCHRILGQIGNVEDDNVGMVADFGRVDMLVLNTLEVPRPGITNRLCIKNNCTDVQCGPREERPVQEHPDVTTVATPQPMQ